MQFLLMQVLNYFYCETLNDLNPQEEMEVREAL